MTIIKKGAIILIIANKLTIILKNQRNPTQRKPEERLSPAKSIASICMPFSQALLHTFCNA